MELGGRATGCNRSPVRNAVATGLAQFRNAKDRKKPVRISPVRFFPYLGIYPDRSGSGCLPGMPKNRTGPDFQTLPKTQQHSHGCQEKGQCGISHQFWPFKAVQGSEHTCAHSIQQNPLPHGNSYIRLYSESHQLGAGQTGQSRVACLYSDLLPLWFSTVAGLGPSGGWRGFCAETQTTNHWA